HLMLKHARQPLRRLDPNFLSMLVQPAHQNLLGPWDVTLQPRYAQAALYADDLAFLPHDLGVDDRAWTFADVVDEQSLSYPDLWSSQPDSSRRIHGLDH